MGQRVQLRTAAASALLCQCSALTSFIGTIGDPGAAFSCTPCRSPCDQAETWSLWLQPGGGSPDCMGLVLPDWY